jgi:hypothetical protein
MTDTIIPPPPPAATTTATSITPVSETKSVLFDKTDAEKKPHAFHREMNRERVVYKTRPEVRSVANAETAKVESAVVTDSKIADKTVSMGETKVDEKKDAVTTTDKTEQSSPVEKEETARLKRVIEAESKLVKAKQEVSKRETEIKVRESNLLKLEKEFATNPIDVINKYIKDGNTHLSTFAKKDPVAFLKGLGVSPDDYIARVFGEDTKVVAPASKVELTPAISKENEETSRRLAALEQERANEKQQKQKETANKLVSEYKQSTTAYLTSNRENYKLLFNVYSETDATNEVVKLQALTHQQLVKDYGSEQAIPKEKQLTQKQAADRIEAYLQKLQVTTPADATASPKSAPETETKEVSKPRLSKIARDDKRPYKIKTREA